MIPVMNNSIQLQYQLGSFLYAIFVNGYLAAVPARAFLYIFIHACMDIAVVHLLPRCDYYTGRKIERRAQTTTIVSRSASQATGTKWRL